MAKAILQALLTFIATFVNTLLAPIDLIVGVLFPSLSTWETSFLTYYTIVKSYLSPRVGYFLSYIPPYTKTAINIFIGVAIVYYTTTLTLHLIIKILIAVFVYGGI